VRRIQQNLARKSRKECEWLYARRGFHAADFWLDNIVEQIEVTAKLRKKCRIPPPCQSLACFELPMTVSNIPQLLKQESQATLRWLGNSDILAAALAKLTSGRALCMQVLLTTKSSLSVRTSKLEKSMSPGLKHLGEAISELRGAGHPDFLLHGLLARAWLAYFLRRPSDARVDLDEAWEIAQRGTMRLHMADIHLYRARLFFREKKYPWADWDLWQTNKSDKSSPPRPRTAADDLAAAEKLINSCGYHRRDQELADAKQAILKSPPQ